MMVAGDLSAAAAGDPHMPRWCVESQGSTEMMLSHILLLGKGCVSEYERVYPVPARRDCIFVIALPWGHVNAPVEFECQETRRQEASSVDIYIAMCMHPTLRIYNAYVMAFECQSNFMSQYKTSRPHYLVSIHAKILVSMSFQLLWEQGNDLCCIPSQLV